MAEPPGMDMFNHVQALANAEDVIHNVNDRLDNIVHANLEAIRATCFLDLSSKQPVQAEEFAAAQKKCIHKQAEAVSVR